MLTSRERARAATRRICFAAGAARPIDYVEALGLEQNPERREQLIRHAAALVANEPDPVAAAREIAEAFLEGVPRHATTAAMRRQHMVEADDGDGRRSIEEIQAAGRVIIEATQRTAALGETCAQIAKQVDELADQVIADEGVQANLRILAGTLRDAARAAGMFLPEPTPAERGNRVALQRRVERAIVDGATTEEIEVMQRADREFDQLEGRGTSLTRDRYIAINLQRWRQAQART